MADKIQADPISVKPRKLGDDKVMLPKSTGVKVAANVKTLATAHGLKTIQQVANEIGVSHHTLENLFKRSLVSGRTLRLIQTWALRKEPECLANGN